MDAFYNLLKPLEYAVAWVMVQFHNALTWLGMESDSGVTWALSIVGLVIVLRVILIPLFVKQIKSSRAMQMIAPDLKKIQNRYKGKKDQASREAMSRETMELYAKHKTNPFASCLPMLAQAPIFFALFRVLNTKVKPLEVGVITGIGALTPELSDAMYHATLFGAPLSSTFLGSSVGSVKVVSAILIVAMGLTTFLTQRQLTQKNMPASALEGPMAQQQKIMLYALPFIFVITGPNFPIGVLIYWTTTNLWSMGQQFYVIRRNPTPGSQADKELKARRAAKELAKNGGVMPESEIEEQPRGQREQPKRNKKKR